MASLLWPFLGKAAGRLRKAGGWLEGGAALRKIEGEAGRLEVRGGRQKEAGGVGLASCDQEVAPSIFPARRKGFRGEKTSWDHNLIFRELLLFFLPILF